VLLLVVVDRALLAKTGIDVLLFGFGVRHVQGRERLPDGITVGAAVA